MSRPTFQLYNSMTRAVEPLTLLDPAGKRVSLYVCGPTIYNYGHMGISGPTSRSICCAAR